MIEGTLVNLRPRERSDIERVYRWVNDAEVTRHLSVRYPMSLAAEEGWFAERDAKPNSFMDLHLAIERIDDELHIGTVSMHRASAEARHARLGIMIGDKAYWSRGYGTDAILTLLGFAFGEMNLRRVDLTVDADNERGIACYRKCGFVEEVRFRQAIYTRGAYQDQLLMGVLREEFEAKRGGA